MCNRQHESGTMHPVRKPINRWVRLSPLSRRLEARQRHTVLNSFHFFFSLSFFTYGAALGAAQRLFTIKQSFQLSRQLDLHLLPRRLFLLLLIASRATYGKNSGNSQWMESRVHLTLATWQLNERFGKHLDNGVEIFFYFVITIIFLARFQSNENIFIISHLYYFIYFFSRFT